MKIVQLRTLSTSLMGCLLLSFVMCSGCNLKGYECTQKKECPAAYTCKQGWCVAIRYTVILPTPGSKSKQCTDGQLRPCYDGSPQTKGVGECKAGQQTCQNAQWGRCVRQVLPKKEEACNGKDDNCDGQTDENCSENCVPQTTKSCYTGPFNTVGTGVCKTGIRTCTAKRVWGPCIDEIVPSPEQCNDKDDDCDGQTDENCHRCIPNHAHRFLGRTQLQRRSQIRWVSNPKGIIQYSAQPGRSARIWRSDSLLPLKILGGAKEPIDSIIWARTHPTFPNQWIFLRHLARQFVIWDLQTNQRIGVIPFPSHTTQQIKQLAFLASGTHLLLLDVRGTLHVWNFAQRRWEAWTREQNIHVLSVHPKRDELYILSSTLKKIIVDKGQPHTAQTIPWTLHDPNSIQVVQHKNEEWLVTWKKGHYLRLFDLKAQKAAHVFPKDAQLYVVSPDQTSLYWVNSDGLIHRFDLVKRALHSSLTTCKKPLSIALPEDLSSIYVACQNGSLQRWDWKGKRELHSITPQMEHIGEILDTDFHPTHELLATASTDKTVRIWSLDIKSASFHRVLQHKKTVYRVRFSPNGQYIATHTQSDAHIWSATTYKHVHSFPHAQTIVDIQWHPNNTQLMTSTQDGTVHVWDTYTKQQIKQWLVPRGRWAGIHFLEQGKRVLAGASNGHIQIWDLNQTKQINQIFAHSKSILNVQLNLHATRLLTTSEDLSLKLWNWRTYRVLHVESGLRDPIRHAAFRPYSHQFAYIRSKSVHIWSQKGARLAAWMASSQPILTLGFSANGKWMATAGIDPYVTLWRCR